MRIKTLICIVLIVAGISAVDWEYFKGYGGGECDIYLDSVGGAWFVGLRDLYHIDSNSTAYNFEQGYFKKHSGIYIFEGFAAQPNGDVWLIYNTSSNGYPTDGVLRYSSESGTWDYLDSTQYKGMESSHITSMIFDHEGTLWLGHGDSHGGCSIFKTTGEWDHTYIASNYKNEVDFITIDNSNRMLFSSEYSDIYEYKDQTFSYISDDHNTKKTQMLSDSKGDVWVLRNTYANGSDDGCVTVYRSGEWTELNNENSELYSKSVERMYIDKKDNVWITFYTSSISKINGDDLSVETFGPENSLKQYSNFREVTEDSTGNIWLWARGIGTLNFRGLLRYDGSNWHEYDKEELEFIDNIYDIHFINDDEGWVTFNDSGCARFTNFTDITSLSKKTKQNKVNNLISNNILKIDYEGTVEFNVFSINGRSIIKKMLTTEELQQGIVLNANHLSSGLYYYQVTGTNLNLKGRFSIVGK